jgi:hypothetical protein
MSNRTHKCLNNKILHEIYNQDEGERLREDLTDSLNQWIKSGIYEMEYFRTAQPKWMVDSAILFNEDKTKALMFVLINDSDIDSNEDYVKFISAEKDMEHWLFIYASLPLKIFLKSKGETIEFSELSYLTIIDLAEDGYINACLCKINYSYVDSENWFVDWRRKKHNQFLNGTLPKSRFDENGLRP